MFLTGRKPDADGHSIDRCISIHMYLKRTKNDFGGFVGRVVRPVSHYSLTRGVSLNFDSDLDISIRIKKSYLPFKWFYYFIFDRI